MTDSKRAAELEARLASLRRGITECVLELIDVDAVDEVTPEHLVLEANLRRSLRRLAFSYRAAEAELHAARAADEVKS